MNLQLRRPHHHLTTHAEYESKVFEMGYRINVTKLETEMLNDDSTSSIAEMSSYISLPTLRRINIDINPVYDEMKFFTS